MLVMCNNSNVSPEGSKWDDCRKILINSYNNMSSEEAHDKPREERPVQQRDEECQKRADADELHERQLFTQPEETNLGDCPICFLPLPIDLGKSMFRTCCSEIICLGCVYANAMSNKHDRVKAARCPFCREPASCSDDEAHKRTMKRIKANDPAALREMGRLRYDKGNHDGAFESLTNAAELGDIDAHYKLGVMYYEGNGVEKDEGKAVYHFRIAAIGGHPTARYSLGYIEGLNGNFERAVKHFIIAANLGCADSMNILWKRYACGDITKEDLDATIRTHQAAIDETKSEQRDRCSGKSWRERRDLRA